MKQTIANRIKEELFHADIDYCYSLDSFKASYPNGVNFCYETVASKAATAVISLDKTEAAYNALVMLVNLKNERSTHDVLSRKIIDQYNNAETTEELEALTQEYYALYTIR